MSLSGGATIPSQEEVSEYFRIQRKGNRKKACFPCRERKVGCDGSRPCKRCVSRAHPAMCSYEPDGPVNKRRRTAPMESATIDPAQRTRDRGSTSLVSRSRSFSGEEHSTPTDRFVGGNSVPGFIVNGLSHVDERELGMSNNDLRNLLLPALGLSQTDRTPPTESGEVSAALASVMKALPRSSEVIRLFQQYKQVVYPLNPHLLDLSTFESELVTFLGRVDREEHNEATVISLPWTAIMFAVMAAGLQFSDLPSEERISGSKSYVRQAFFCLHIESGFITASVPTIIAVLILVTVLQNELATEAAWSYLGLASRLAQSLGLHNDVSLDQSSDNSPTSLLWKAIVWQDCLLSMCFGRQPVTSTISKGNVRVNETEEQDLEYRSAMYLLSSTSLELMKEETKSSAQLRSQASRLQRNIDRAKPELRSSETCRSIEEHIVHLAFRLNSSFALATLLRQALAAGKHWQAQPEDQRVLHEMCVDACVAAVESFIGLHKLSVVAERSWAMLHNGLSCALILLLIDEARGEDKIIQLQQQLVNIMSQTVKSGDRGSLLWGPHARILTAMKVLGSARSARSAASPPLQVFSPNEHRIVSPSTTYRTERREVTLNRGNSSFNSDTNENNNDSNVFFDFTDLDFDQQSLDALYNSIMWGQPQAM